MNRYKYSSIDESKPYYPAIGSKWWLKGHRGNENKSRIITIIESGKISACNPRDYQDHIFCNPETFKRLYEPQ